MNLTAIKDRLTAKAESDPEFRRQLIANPRVAIPNLIGQEIPPEIDVTVFEETPNSFCLVLPPDSTSELNDADLACVSGGNRMHKEGQRIILELDEAKRKPLEQGK